MVIILEIADQFYTSAGASGGADDGVELRCEIILPEQRTGFNEGNHRKGAAFTPS